MVVEKVKDIRGKPLPASMEKLRVLFKPGKIGKLEIKNRLVMSPMATNLASVGGDVTRELLDYYVERARGGSGLIITENVRTEAKIQPGRMSGANLRLDNDSYIAGMSELADAIHECGAKIFAQLTLGPGRFCQPGLRPTGEPALAVSDIYYPSWPKWEVHLLTTEEIEKLIEAYAEAAMRAKKAEIDGIDLHGHGIYLLAEFMSPYTNKRTDKFGDPAAVPLELIKAIKNKVGDDYPITFRFGIDEFLEGGRTLEQSRMEAKRFEQAGIHAILIAAGNFWVRGGALPACPPMSYPQGNLRSLSKAIRETVNIPIVISSKIMAPSIAARILEAGEADFIGLGRALLADPEWPNKVAEGRLVDICPCIADLDGCLNRISSRKKIRCSVNARCGRESEYREIEPAKKPKKILVVGGGLGGMKAAQIAASRGHEVTLYEKGNRLGGTASLAGTIPHKGDINEIVKYLASQIKELGVHVELGKEVTLRLVKRLQPEVVIVATGAHPTIPEIPGIDRPNVCIADDIIAEKTEVMGESILVVGTGFVAYDTAMFLAEKRHKKVTILEPLTHEASGFGPLDMNHIDQVERLAAYSVKIISQATIEEITDKGIIVSNKEGTRHNIDADSVVLAIGHTANKELAEALEGVVPKVYAVGDCVEPRGIMHAIWDGFHVGSDV